MDKMFVGMLAPPVFPLSASRGSVGAARWPGRRRSRGRRNRDDATASPRKRVVYFNVYFLFFI